MRLIDADELIEIVEGSEELLDFQKDELIACVDVCDTAYDVEKVLEQIKYKLFCRDLPTNIVDHIVRKGGVE